MTEFFASGRAIDLILAIVALEVLVLAVWPRVRGAMQLGDVASLVLPGVMLLLAVRCALIDAPYTLTAALLAAAFVCHLWDIARRRKAARSSS